MKAKAPDTSIPTITIPPTVYTRERLMEVTGNLIDETFDRVSGDRFRLREGDRERIAYIRLLKDLLQMYADLLQDSGTPKTVNGLPRVTTPQDIEYEQWQKEELHSLSSIMMSNRSR